MKRAILYLMLTGFILFLNACSEERVPYEYQVPENTEDGWEVASVDKEGLDPVPLEDMMNELDRYYEPLVHSILLLRGGKLVFEEYFEGYLYSMDPPGSNGDHILYTRKTDHFLASVSKSVTSVIFGAAVKEGYIGSLDQKLVEVLPEYTDILTGEKAGITLEHLLTMSSGLEWDESSKPYGDPANHVTGLFNAEDPIEFALSLDMVSEPGEEFLYNSGSTNVLGAVVQKVTGKSLLEYGNEVLFDPLDIVGGFWEQLPGGYFFASGGLYLRPRELAKIGYLFLNEGYWGSEQVITGDWIEESVKGHISTDGNTLSMAHEYGYQWWRMNFNVDRKSYPCFFAAGWGGQYMFIFPELDMMVLFFGGKFLKSGPVSFFSLVENYILPSLN
jgi:CubicO group peptidase (beta-lactamase class C family)